MIRFFICAIVLFPTLALAEGGFIEHTHSTISFGASGQHFSEDDEFGRNESLTLWNQQLDLDTVFTVADRVRVRVNFNHTKRERENVFAPGSYLSSNTRALIEGDVLLGYGFSIGGFFERGCGQNCGDFGNIDSGGLVAGFANDRFEVRATAGRTNREFLELAGFEEVDRGFFTDYVPVYEKDVMHGQALTLSGTFFATPELEISVGLQSYMYDVKQPDMADDYAGIGALYAFDNGLRAYGAYQYHQYRQSGDVFFKTHEAALGVAYDFADKGLNLVLNAEVGRIHTESPDFSFEAEKPITARFGVAIPLGNTRRHRIGANSLLHEIRDPDLSGYGATVFY